MPNPSDAALAARLTELTRDLILIPGTESRPTELRRCLEFLGNHLESLPNINLRYLENGGCLSLVATPVDCDRPDILLCGHADVVDHPDPSSFRSAVHAGRIWGPGAGDMKGALAIILTLFRNLLPQARLPSLGIAITSDEERGGEHGVKFLLGEAGLSCGTAIIPDGGSPSEITVEEKGIVHATLTARGYSGHAARPWLCQNAIDFLHAALASIRALFENLRSEDSPDHWFPTCSVTVIRTPNITINRIPSSASASLDIRFPPPFTVASITDLIRSATGPNLDLEIHVSAEPTHLAPDPKFREITSLITGTEAKFIRASGGSDARFFCAAGIPTLLSRPLVGNLHGEDEWIDIASMVSFYRVCESYIRQHKP